MEEQIASLHGAREELEQELDSLHEPIGEEESLFGMGEGRALRCGSGSGRPLSLLSQSGVRLLMALAWPAAGRAR